MKLFGVFVLGFIAGAFSLGIAVANTPLTILPPGPWGLGRVYHDEPEEDWNTK